MFCGADSKDLTSSFAALGKWREWRGKSCWFESTTPEFGSGERVGRVHGVLLHDTREPEDNSSVQVGSREHLP